LPERIVMPRRRFHTSRFETAAALAVGAVALVSIGLGLGAWRTPRHGTPIPHELRRIDLSATIVNVSSSAGQTGALGPFDVNHPGTQQVGTAFVTPAALRAAATSIRYTVSFGGDALAAAKGIKTSLVLASSSGWRSTVATAAVAAGTERRTYGAVDLAAVYQAIAGFERQTAITGQHYGLDLVVDVLNPTATAATASFHFEIGKDGINLPAEYEHLETVAIPGPTPLVHIVGLSVERAAIEVAALIGSLVSLMAAVALWGRVRRGWGLPLAQRHLARYGRHIVLVDDLPMTPFDTVIELDTIHALGRVARSERAVICVKDDTFAVRGKGAVYLARLPEWAAPLPIYQRPRERVGLADRGAVSEWAASDRPAELTLDVTVTAAALPAPGVIDLRESEHSPN
jgi:hypothetical protein